MEKILIRTRGRMMDSCVRNAGVVISQRSQITRAEMWFEMFVLSLSGRYIWYLYDSLRFHYTPSNNLIEHHDSL